MKRVVLGAGVAVASYLGWFALQDRDHTEHAAAEHVPSERALDEAAGAPAAAPVQAAGHALDQFAGDPELKARKELAFLAALGDELELTTAERAALEQAMRAQQRERAALFAALAARHIGTDQVSAGLKAQREAFNAAITAALGVTRAEQVRARLREAHGYQAPVAPDAGT